MNEIPENIERLLVKPDWTTKDAKEAMAFIDHTVKMVDASKQLINLAMQAEDKEEFLFYLEAIDSFKIWREKALILAMRHHEPFTCLVEKAIFLNIIRRRTR